MKYSLKEKKEYKCKYCSDSRIIFITQKHQMFGKILPGMYSCKCPFCKNLTTH